MSTFVQFLRALTDRQILIWIAALSAMTLAGAHGFENFADLPPCPLCLDQRETYWAAIAFCGLGVALLTYGPSKTSILPVIAMGLVVASLAYGTYLAGYHTGIEQKWWPGPTTCTGSGAQLSIREMLADEESKVVMCDDIPWSLFGISLAGYNFLIALALTGLSSLAFFRRINRKS